MKYTKKLQRINFLMRICPSWHVVTAIEEVEKERTQALKKAFIRRSTRKGKKGGWS